VKIKVQDTDLARAGSPRQLYSVLGLAGILDG